MSIQVRLAPVARQKRFKGTTIVHHLERPEENALGLYAGKGWSPLNSFPPKPPGLPTTVPRHSKLPPTRLAHHPVNKLTKARPRDVQPHHDAIEVWDDFHKAQEDGEDLQIRCLAGGMGIAVTGQYRSSPKAGQVRYDAFLAHLVEGRMLDTLRKLLDGVDDARKDGLEDVNVVVCYRDEKTLKQDPRMLWTSRMALSELRLRERLLQLVEERLGDAPARLHPYHVLDEKTLGISASDRMIRILNL